MVSKSKWSKYNILKQTRALQSYIPKTKPFNKINLFSMVGLFGRVIVKPSNGSGGKGVIRVCKAGHKEYEIRYEHHKKRIKKLSLVYVFIAKNKKGRMIIQRHIQLAEMNRRPFDLRVMVQRDSKKSAWRINGKLAKVAGKGYIVTNVRRSNGNVVQASTAIRYSNIRSRSTDRILRTVNRISKVSASKLSSYYNSIHTVGMDIGVDQDGKCWIIEANLSPDISLFKKLKSKREYNRITRRKWMLR